MNRSYNPDLSSDAIANAGSDFKRSAETVIDKTSESAQTVLGGLSDRICLSMYRSRWQGFADVASTHIGIAITLGGTMCRTRW